MANHCTKRCPLATGIWLALGLAISLTSLFAPHGAARAAQSPATMIIFDGSGSMWGGLDGEKKPAKFELARETLRQSFVKIQPTGTTGLMSFGHRRTGDCSDIEIIVPMGTGDAARLLGPLDKHNPRGKGPIADSLKAAATALGKTPRSSIILIHDNADNCRKDPCEAATEIAAANPDLKIHLVSIAMEAEDVSRMSCVAKSTGGQLFEANDATQMASAITDALKLAMLDPKADAPQAAPFAKPTAPEAAPSVPSGPPGIIASARLVAQSPPLAVPVQWRVLKTGTDTVVAQAVGSTLTLPLDAGSYTLEGSVGFATARKPIDVQAKGPTRIDLSLEAAALRIAVQDLKDSPNQPGAIVTLNSGAPTPTQMLKPLWIGRALDADFIVPAGNYVIKVSDSLAVRDEAITLAAGNIQNKTIVMGSGRLELAASAKADGDPLDGVTFYIAKDDPESPDGRLEIARSSATRPSFVLAAGTYYVTARMGTAEVRQRIGIGAGDQVKRIMPFGLARLQVAAELPAARKDTSPLARMAIHTRIFSLEGEPRELAYQSALSPEFNLAAGRYRIEATIGALNVKATQDVDLKAGSTRRVALKLDANTVKLKLAPSQKPAQPTDVFWELRDSQGGLVMRSSQLTPDIVVAPGRYTARLEVQDRRVEKSIDVAADGQPRVIEFALP